MSRKDTSAAIWGYWIQHGKGTLAIECRERYNYPNAWAAMDEEIKSGGELPYMYGISYRPGVRLGAPKGDL